MGISKVQFQPSLSMVGCMGLYGTEEKCPAALVRLRGPEGFVCQDIIGIVKHKLPQKSALMRTSS